MIWFLIVLVLLILVAFSLTWSYVSSKADHDQYARTCGHFDDYRRKVDELVNNHSGYGPRQQHVPALDQLVTLCLYPKAPGGDGDGYFYIPSADTYKTGYAMMATEGSTDVRQSTERSMTLRELLNRLLKDVPVELVHSVEEDWKFAPEPVPPPFVIYAPPV